MQGHFGRPVFYSPFTGLREKWSLPHLNLVKVVFPGPLLNFIQLLAGIAFLDPAGVLADMLHLPQRNNCSIEFWENSLFLLPDARGCVMCH